MRGRGGRHKNFTPRARDKKRSFQGKSKNPNKRFKKDDSDDEEDFVVDQREPELVERPPIWPQINFEKPEDSFGQLLQTFGVQKQEDEEIGESSSSESDADDKNNTKDDDDSDSESNSENEVGSDDEEDDSSLDELDCNINSDEDAGEGDSDSDETSESDDDNDEEESDEEGEESQEDSNEEHDQDSDESAAEEEESGEKSCDEKTELEPEENVTDDSSKVTPLQKEILDILKTKKDFYYPQRTHENSEQLRNAYCLHIIKHVLDAKKIIEENDEKLKTAGGKLASTNSFDCRDQGFTSAKVLVLVPHRQDAANVMMSLCTLLFPSGEAKLAQAERFISEFYSDEDKKKKGGIRKDFDETFAGNTDDCFQIGIKMSKDEIVPYTGFYEADIIIASPFGLRQQQAGKKETYDYLSSIEIVVVDQANVLYMQNWKLVISVMLSLHRQPKEMHKANIARIKLYSVNGQSKQHCQLIVYSSVSHPAINKLFNKFRSSNAGHLTFNSNNQPGILINSINASVTHIFHRFDASSIADTPEARFQTFITDVLPWYKERNMHHVLMLIPSSFDYIRLRNYFTKLDIPCAKMSENSNDKELWKEKTAFYEGSAEVMLLTERYYFYTRNKIKSVQHLIFYEPPVHHHFYRELCGMANRSAGSKAGHQIMCTTLYSKYDGIPLTNLLGIELAKTVMQSKQQRYTYCK